MGVNIVVAWVSVDVYIGYGWPSTPQNPCGCFPVSEKNCNKLNSMSRESSHKYNLKNLFGGIDVSNISEVEITESSTNINTFDNSKTSIKLGKYPVDRDGNFEVEINYQK
jgi:hypothetical protein